MTKRHIKDCFKNEDVKNVLNTVYRWKKTFPKTVIKESKIIRGRENAK